MAHRQKAALFLTAECATHCAINIRPFYFRPPKAPITAQQMEGCFCSVAEGVSCDATIGRPFCFQPPNVQPIAQPMGGRFVFGSRGHNLRRNPWIAQSMAQPMDGVA